MLSPVAAAAGTTAIIANTSLSAAMDASVAVGRAAKAAVPAAVKGVTARATFGFSANAAIDAVTASCAAAHAVADSTNIADVVLYASAADAAVAAEAAFTSLATAISDFLSIGSADAPGSNNATARAAFAAATKAIAIAVLAANSAADHAIDSSIVAASNDGFDDDIKIDLILTTTSAPKEARARKKKVQPKVLPTKKKSSVFLCKQPRIHDVTQQCQTKNAKMNHGVIKETSCISTKGHAAFASNVPRF